jgi:ribosomal protein S26
MVVSGFNSAVKQVSSAGIVQDELAESTRRSSVYRRGTYTLPRVQICFECCVQAGVTATSEANYIISRLL